MVDRNGNTATIDPDRINMRAREQKLDAIATMH